MREQVTIIVPVYNTEKYLEQCLRSLQEQTYENLQILLINDGSTDHSAEICRRFCERDDRFHLIEQENKGLAMARNTGLDHATGKYICFVDSDDYIHASYVQILYENLINYHADISMCGYIKFQGPNCPEAPMHNSPVILSVEQMIADISTSGPENKSEQIVLACNKLIKAQMFENLRFPNKIHEDEFIIAEYILRTEHAVWSDAPLYYYRQHASSITGADNKKDLKHLQVLEAYRKRVRAFSEGKYRKLFNRVICAYFENATIMFLLMKDDKNKWKMIWKIYPQFLIMLIRYAPYLKKGQIYRYAQFMISPNHYRKKYWK